MSIGIRCDNPDCAKALKVKDELAGKRIKCPGCGTLIRVAVSEAIAASPPPAHVPRASVAPAAVRMRSAPPRMAPPRPGIHYPWVISILLVLAAIATLVISLVTIENLHASIHRDPEMIKLQENFAAAAAQPGGFDRFFADERRVRERVAPNIGFWRLISILSIGATALFVLLELIAYCFMLGRRGLSSVLRWYIGSIVAVPCCAVVAGIGFLIIANANSHLDNNPAIREVRNNLQMPNRFQVAEGLERQARDEVRTQFALGIFCVAASAFIAVRMMLGQGLNFSILLYKLWNRVQDGHARTTPGKALGFLFIPFFNFYWAFVVLPGIADELNRCAYYRSLHVTPASRGLFLTYCILVLTAVIPFLGILTSLVALVISILAFRGAVGVALALEQSE